MDMEGSDQEDDVLEEEVLEDELWGDKVLLVMSCQMEHVPVDAAVAKRVPSGLHRIQLTLHAEDC